jgi:hypothetical protein
LEEGIGLDDMSKNSKKTGLEVRHVIYPLLAFIVTYILVAFITLIANSVTRGFSSIQGDIRKYISSHDKEIKQKVFQNIFSKAEQCNILQSENSRSDCFKIISHELAVALREEEFRADPNDLFFVKEVGKSYYRLGWDGRLEDITTKVNEKLLKARTPYFILFMTRNCNFFGSENMNACEVYESIDLSTNQRGYMVRLEAMEEENDIMFISVIPIILLLNLGSLAWAWQSVSIWLALLNILLPLFVSYMVWKKYRNSKIK